MYRNAYYGCVKFEFETLSTQFKELVAHSRTAIEFVYTVLLRLCVCFKWIVVLRILVRIFISVKTC